MLDVERSKQNSEEQSDVKEDKYCKRNPHYWLTFFKTAVSSAQNIKFFYSLEYNGRTDEVEYQ